MIARGAGNGSTRGILGRVFTQIHDQGIEVSEGFYLGLLT
jgi:hypothetical protein